jgi:hypothetical protein
MSSTVVNAILLSAIVLLILFMLWLASFQKRTFRTHDSASVLVKWAAPLARWSLGLLIVAYLLFIRFQLHHRLTPLFR